MERKYLYIAVTLIVFSIIGYIIIRDKNPIKQESANSLVGTTKIVHPELGEITLPELSGLPEGITGTLKLKKENKSSELIKPKENINSVKKSMQIQDDEAVIQEALKAFSHDTALVEDALSEIGFKKEGIESIVSKQEESLLSIEDMPDSIRKDILIELEKNKKNGFDEIDEKDAEEITGIINSIVGTTLDIPNITFVLSKLPASVIQNYEYIGYTFPNSLSVVNPNIQHDTAQRVFQKLDSKSILIIEESSLKSGGAVLLKEFVNTTVNALPAIYAIKKSKNNKTYAMLNWTTSDFAYSLYQVGSLETARDILIFVGSELSKINTEEERKTNDTSLPSTPNSLPQN